MSNILTLEQNYLLDAGISICGSIMDLSKVIRIDYCRLRRLDRGKCLMDQEIEESLKYLIENPEYGRVVTAKKFKSEPKLIVYMDETTLEPLYLTVNEAAGRYREFWLERAQAVTPLPLKRRKVCEPWAVPEYGELHRYYGSLAKVAEVLGVNVSRVKNRAYGMIKVSPLERRRLEVVLEWIRSQKDLTVKPK